MNLSHSNPTNQISSLPDKPLDNTASLPDKTDHAHFQLNPGCIGPASSSSEDDDWSDPILTS